MKKLIYDDIVKDVNNRMATFETLRPGHYGKSPSSLNDLKETLLEFYAIDAKKVGENAPSATSSASDVANNDGTKSAKKESKGFLDSITGFFADDPKKAEAARIAAEAKKQEALKKAELEKK